MRAPTLHITRLLAVLLALSGSGALICEVVWMRRMALAAGSSGVAIALTLALYMAGLGMGSIAASRREWSRAPRGYGTLELAAAGWAVAMPALIVGAQPLLVGDPGTRVVGAAVLLVPPAMLHGATLPALGSLLPSGRAMSRLYAANTAGAVIGVLAATFWLLPTLGVRGTELAAAACSGTAGLSALIVAHRSGRPTAQAPAKRQPGTGVADPAALAAVGIAGLVSMALEVCWSRLGALLLGGSVYAFAVVLAVFLGGIAIGAEVGRRHGRAALAPALAALGLLAAAGTLTWRGLPHAVGAVWSWGGAEMLLPAGAALLAVAMAGAPIASGAVFTAALDQPGRAPGRVAGAVLAANTAGSVVGATMAGLWALPALGLRATALFVSVLAGLAGVGLLAAQGRRGPAAVVVVGLAAMVGLAPAWDPALYAVGVGLRVHEFADLSPRAIERFAHEGWDLEYYRAGRSASVAVGRSTSTGNRWLSLNGKVDASTGDDMPTQLLSGELPVQLARDSRPPGAPLRAGVVGLASGVTAGATLAAGATDVLVIELEPAVVEAAALFASHNFGVLDDPRATIQIDDARAVLQRPGPPFAVLVSEPSNPWITGVSNLFTREYWALGHARLEPGGLFVQWVQLYALPPEALRSLVATFASVFDDVWLFETIPGADALLIGTTRGHTLSAQRIAALPLSPTLDPAGVRRLGAGGRLNTDDRPWVEFAAPRWLHRQTGASNRALLDQASQPSADDTQR